MLDPGIDKNYQILHKICLRYGCSASVEANARNEFRSVTLRIFSRVHIPGLPFLFGKSSPPLYIKMKSLKNPNWEKLEELVVNYAVLNSFTQ